MSESPTFYQWLQVCLLPSISEGFAAVLGKENAGGSLEGAGNENILLHPKKNPEPSGQTGLRQEIFYAGMHSVADGSETCIGGIKCDVVAMSIVAFRTCKEHGEAGGVAVGCGKIQTRKEQRVWQEAIHHLKSPKEGI